MKKSTVEKNDITKKQLRILFIDLSNENTQTAINVIQNTFKSCSYKRVETKKDFLAELSAFKPDIIISDLSIPELCCNDILRLLWDNLLHTPLIIYSSLENEADAIKCVQSGAWDYVIKEQPNRLGITLIKALEETPVDSELIKNTDTTNELQAIIDRYLRWEANIPGMLFLIDLKPDLSYAFIQVTSACKEMLGLAPNDIMNDPSLFPGLMHPDDALTLGKEALEAAKTGSPFRYEARFRINGKLRWFFFISHSELHADSSVTINGILMDITDKKQAEEAAAKERNLMNILMDNLPDAIYFKDLKSRFIKVNKGCLSKIGAVLENEILMKTDFDIFQFEHALESRNDELEIIKTGKPLINKIEKEIFASGELKWVSTTKIPIKNNAGDIVGTFGVSRDISEQKHFEESLYAERNLLRTLVDAIPDRIFVKDTEGKYLLNNKAHLNRLGLANQEETIGKTDYDYVKPEVAVRYEAYDKLVIDTGRPLLNHEEQSFYASGQRGWHLSTKIPLRDNKNKIIGLVSISRDITRSKKIQEQLKSSETRLRHIITAVSAILYTIKIEMDLPGIKGVNLTLVWIGDNIRQFGYEPDHLVKSNLREKLIHPDDIDTLRAKMPVLFEKNKLVVEYRIQHKAGHYIWLRDEMVLIRNAVGKPKEIFGSWLDITEQKPAETSASNERNLIQTLMENLPDLIYFKDLESRFIKVNKAYLQKLGIKSENEILMKTDFDLFKSDHANEAREDELKIINTGQGIINKVEKETWRSGKLTWVSSTKLPLKDRAGKIIGTFGASRDITDMVHAEEALAVERNLMSTLINSIPDSIFVEDIEGKFILNNAAHIKTLGLKTHEEAYGKTAFDFYSRDVAMSFINDDLKIIQTGKPILNKEERTYSGGKHAGWHLITKVPLRNNQNIITGIVCVSRDITKSKEIQEQLKTSEARIRHIINTVSAVLYTIKISGTTLTPVWVGDNIKQFGYQPKEALSPEWWLDVIHPDDFDYVKSSLQAIDKNDKLLLEFRFKCKDGLYIWLSNETVLIRDNDGKPAELFGSCLDITERMKAQEALLTSEAQLSVAIKIAHLAHWEYHTLTKKFLFNDQYYSLLHTSAEKIGGYNISFDTVLESLIYSEDRSIIISEFQKAVKTKDPYYSSEVEFRMNFSDGNIGYFAVSFFIMKDTHGITIKCFGVTQDISERKKTEEALIASETKLVHAFKIAHLAHWEYDIINDIFTFNDQFYSLFRTTAEKVGGYSMSAAQYSKRFVYPEDIQIVGTEIKKTLESSDPNYNSQVEHRIVYADGEIGYISVRIFTFRNEEGKIYKSFGVTQDITERKKAEEALIASETKLSHALKIAHLAHWEYDIINDIFTFNDQFYSLFRTTAEKVGGYSMSAAQYSNRFVYSEDIQIVSIAIKETLESSDPNYNSQVEHRIVYADGEIGYISVRIFTFRNEEGKIYKSFGVTQDITERKHADEALRASEYFLRKSQSVAHIGSFKYDIKSGSWESSKTLDEILGISSNYPKNIKGWINLVHPAHRKIVFRIVKKQLLINKRIEREFIIVRQNDKQERWALTLADLEFDGEGNPVTLIGTVQDITERILREQEKIELSEQLQLRNVELETMLADLKLMQGTLVQTEKMASLGQLTAGIAHEINNPLAFVSSNINRLKEYFQDTVGLLNKWQDLYPDIKDKPDFRAKLLQINDYKEQIDLNFILQDYDRMLQGIYEGTGRIKKIVEGMRGFAHMADNTYSEAHINQAIDETLTIVWNEIKYKATIEKKYDDLPAVTCNIGEIKQVLVNLLVNASHAIKEKGTIYISTSSDNEYVYIQIQDTGEGIRPENLKRIFDPFFTTKAVGKGTGLGLWISSTIIEKHCGSITVESKIDIGSTFKIKLPIKLKTAHTAVEAATK